MTAKPPAFEPATTLRQRKPEDRLPTDIDLRPLTLGRDADGEEGRNLYGETYEPAGLTFAPTVEIPDAARPAPHIEAPAFLPPEHHDHHPEARTAVVEPVAAAEPPVAPSPVTLAPPVQHAPEPAPVAVVEPPSPPPVVVTLPPIQPETPPARVTPAPTIDAFTRDSGRSDTDHLTNDGNPVLSGHAQAGAAVVVLHEGQEIARTVAATDGTWSAQVPTTLADGAHEFTATAKAPDAMVSAPSDPLSLVVDRTPPGAVPLDLLSDSNVFGDRVTNAAAPRLDVLGVLARPGDEVVVVLDGQPTMTLPRNALGMASNIDLPHLEDGTHSVHTVSTDAAGNVTQGPDISFVVDTTPPAPPPFAISGPAWTPTITGTAEAGNLVEVTAFPTATGVYGHETARVYADASGHWTYSPTLPGTERPVAWHVEARQMDLAGNWSAEATGDTQPAPVVEPPPPPPAPTPLEAPALVTYSQDTGTSGDGLTRDNTPTVAGIATGSATVEISRDGVVVGTAAADASGHFSYEEPVAIADGRHEYVAVVVATDGRHSNPSAPLAFTVDATPPAAPVPDLAALKDSGSSDSDNLTRADVLTITGSTDPGTTLHLTVDGRDLGAVVIGSDGTWQMDVPGLEEGRHTFLSTAEDLAGNVSQPGRLDVVVDRSVAPTTPDLAAPSDTGLSDGDNITRATDLVLTGQADAGATVTLYQIIGTYRGALGTVTAGDDGRWQFELSNARSGSLVVQAETQDAAGNVTTGANLTVTVDRTHDSMAPNLDTDGQAGYERSLTNDATPTFAMSNSYSSAAVEGVLSIDGTEVTRLPVSDASGPGVPAWTGLYTLTDALADGAHTAVWQSTDRAGNTAVSSTTRFVVDTVALAPPFTATPVVQATNSAEGSASIAGTGEAGGVVTIYRNNGYAVGSAVVNSSGHWSLPVSISYSAGDEFEARQTDRAGNTSDFYRVAMPGGTPPAAVPATPSLDLVTASDTGASTTDNITRTSDLHLTVTGTPSSTIRVQMASSEGAVAQTFTMDPSGSHELVFTAPASDQAVRFTATATNSAGAAPGYGDLWVTVDRSIAVPSLRLDQASDTGFDPTDHRTGGVPLHLQGSTEAGATVAVFLDGAKIGTTTASSTGTWDLTTSGPLADGQHAITARATDIAGNTSADTPAMAVTVDAHAPVFTSGGANASYLSVIFNEPLATGTLSAGEWTITASGTPVAFTSVQKSPYDPARVEFALSRPLLAGEPVVVSYAPSRGSADIGDEFGNTTTAFTAAVSNITPSGPGPGTLDLHYSAGTPERLDGIAGPAGYFAPFSAATVTAPAGQAVTLTVGYDSSHVLPAILPGSGWTISGSGNDKVATATFSNAASAQIILRAIQFDYGSLIDAEPSAPGMLGRVSDAGIKVTASGTGWSATDAATVAHLTQSQGYAGDDTVLLPFSVDTDRSVNLAGGNDTLQLKPGSNRLTVIDTEMVQGTASADHLTLNMALNTARDAFSTVDLGQGDDTLTAGGVDAIHAMNVEHLTGRTSSSEGYVVVDLATAGTVEASGLAGLTLADHSMTSATVSDTGLVSVKGGVSVEVSVSNVRQLTVEAGGSVQMHNTATDGMTLAGAGHITLASGANEVTLGTSSATNTDHLVIDAASGNNLRVSVTAETPATIRLGSTDDHMTIGDAFASYQNTTIPRITVEAGAGTDVVTIDRHGAYLNLVGVERVELGAGASPDAAGYLSAGADVGVSVLDVGNLTSGFTVGVAASSVSIHQGSIGTIELNGSAGQSVTLLDALDGTTLRGATFSGNPAIFHLTDGHGTASLAWANLVATGGTDDLALSGTGTIDLAGGNDTLRLDSTSNMNAVTLGAGADTMIVTGSARATIVDFDPTQDRVVFSGVAQGDLASRAHLSQDNYGHLQVAVSGADPNAAASILTMQNLMPTNQTQADLDRIMSDWISRGVVSGA